jgi:2-dehydropantoate 2-reductase
VTDRPTAPREPTSAAHPAREAVPPRVAVVVGGGAVGSFLGGTLAVAGWDVTLLRRHGTGDGSTTPLVIEGPRRRRTSAPVRRVGSPEAAPDAPDVVLVAVKMFDLPSALEAAARWPDAPLATVQNGVGAEEQAAAARSSPLIALSLTTAVEPTAEGVARRRAGGLGIAPVRGDTAAIRHELADAFADGGLPTTACPDAAAMKWSKLLANLVANASSGLLDMDAGAVWADRAGFDLERRQLREAVAVMHAQGLRVVSLPGGEVGALLLGLRFPAFVARPVTALAIGRARGGKPPSLQIRLRGGGTGPTEAPWLNGAVAAAGARLGVPTPVNMALASLVEEMAADPAAGDRWTHNPTALRDTAVAWASRA